MDGKILTHDTLRLHAAAQQADIPCEALRQLCHDRAVFSITDGKNTYVSRSAVPFLRRLKEEHPEILDDAETRMQQFRARSIDGITSAHFREVIR